MSRRELRRKKRLPRVSLMGRRNVGKSTLLNALYGRRRAITDDIPGLTRDILEVEIKRSGLHFMLSDTPGLDIEDPGQLEQAVLERARTHLSRVDLILLVLEAPGPAPADQEFLEIVRRSGTPFLVVVNKVDDSATEPDCLAECYRGGFPAPLAISARGRRHLGVLLGRMAEVHPALGSVKNEEPISGEEPAGAPGQRRKEKDDSSVVSDAIPEETRIAIVGRPNAGKSSLFNQIVDEDVVLVSDVPGTTRDTVDLVFRFQNHAIRLVDTAGLRRRSHLRDHQIDFFSTTRTRRAIQDARVVVHLVDALQGITDLDKKISALIQEVRRPAVIGINKWDAVEDKTEKSTREFLDRLYFQFPHARNMPVVFLSARTGQRVNKLLEQCLMLDERMRRRIPTGELNDRIAVWFRKLPGRGQGLRILYASQVETEPPVFVFFVNKRARFRANQTQFFENQIREAYDLAGIPIRILVRERNEGDDS